LYGNLSEIKKMKKEADLCVLDPNSNDIFPRVFPQYHQWMSQYGTVFYPSCFFFSSFHRWGLLNTHISCLWYIRRYISILDWNKTNYIHLKSWASETGLVEQVRFHYYTGETTWGLHTFR
jgi:hypothetical protein